MNVKRVVMAVIALAVITLPLTASAYSPIYYNISGIVNGNTTISVSDITVLTGKKATAKYTLPGGVVDAADNTGVLGIDNSALKGDVTQMYVKFGPDASGVDAEAYVTARFLKSGTSSGSGPGSIDFYYPSTSYIETHVGTFRQWRIRGAFKGGIAFKYVNNVPVNAVIRVGKVTPYRVTWEDFLNDGQGNTNSQGNSGDEPFDGALTISTMNVVIH